MAPSLSMELEESVIGHRVYKLTYRDDEDYILGVSLF